MNETLVIAAYPLSAGYRSALGGECGELEVLDVPTLRRLGTRRLLATLGRYRGGTCVIALEDPSSEPLLPALELLALASRAARIEVAGPDPRETRRRISRAEALGSGASLAAATVRVRRAARRAASETTKLLAADPSAIVRATPERVLYLNGNLWFGVKVGGSVGHVAGVVNGLLETGLEVDVAAASRPPLVREAAGFVELAPPRHLGLPSELNVYSFSQSAAATLIERARHTRYDLLYQRLSLGNYAGAAVARATGVPLVIEYNGSEVWIARKWGRPLRNEAIAMAAEEASLRHAAVVVTVSRVLGDELRARGVAPERIVVYPNCVDPTMFEPAQMALDRVRLRSALGFDDRDVVATFVGTFGRWHGAEVLARAIRRLVDDDPGWLERSRLRFLLVGDGLTRPEVSEILGQPGLSVTTLTGLVPQADAPAYLAASDVLVSPHVPNDDGSPFFGSPTKLFEYMAAGRAIIASDLDQIGDVLRPALDLDQLRHGGESEDGRLALLVPPGDISALLEGLRLLAERSTLRATMGQAARRAVLERYTWQHHVSAILARVERLGRR